MEKQTLTEIRTWATDKGRREVKGPKREALADHVAQFLAAGGEIRPVPQGASGIDLRVTKATSKSSKPDARRFVNKRTARILVNPPVPTAAQKRGQVHRTVV